MGMQCRVLSRLLSSGPFRGCGGAGAFAGTTTGFTRAGYPVCLLTDTNSLAVSSHKAWIRHSSCIAVSLSYSVTDWCDTTTELLYHNSTPCSSCQCASRSRMRVYDHGHWTLAMRLRYRVTLSHQEIQSNPQQSGATG